jgi:hypothetical protein
MSISGIFNLYLCNRQAGEGVFPVKGGRVLRVGTPTEFWRCSCVFLWPSWIQAPLWTKIACAKFGDFLMGDCDRLALIQVTVSDVHTSTRSSIAVDIIKNYHWGLTRINKPNRQSGGAKKKKKKQNSEKHKKSEQSSHAMQHTHTRDAYKLNTNPSSPHKPIHKFTRPHGPSPPQHHQQSTPIRPQARA